MKHWINRNYKTLIITAFLIPIITVALVSISHVTQWYGITNPLSWAIYLSVGIEIAAMSALAAISANMGKHVYFPFIVVTLIQLIGNIFFSYEFIDVASPIFKSWVELASPLVGFFGIEPTDIIGHKRFIAIFAGGLLPVISLSFLHMLVKFTEEDRLKDLQEETTKIDSVPTPPEVPVIDAKEMIAEISRARLSEEDLKILEDILIRDKVNEPNEALKEAYQKYTEENTIKSTEDKEGLTPENIDFGEKLWKKLVKEKMENSDVLNDDDMFVNANSMFSERLADESDIDDEMNSYIPEENDPEPIVQLSNDDLERLEKILLPKIDMNQEEEDTSKIDYPEYEEEEEEPTYIINDIVPTPSVSPSPVPLPTPTELPIVEEIEKKKRNPISRGIGFTGQLG